MISVFSNIRDEKGEDSMKLSNEYRYIAEETCKPYSSKLAVVWLVVWAVTALTSGGIYGASSGSAFSTVLDIISLLITGPLTMGTCMIIQKVYTGAGFETKDVFDGFKEFGKSFVLALLEAVFVGLWTLLLIVPGIMAAYSYSMAYYIAIDNPDLDANECISKSKAMMRGYRWDLFCLQFSYIGWIILCILTLGILMLWVGPKMECAKYAFYCDLVGKNTADETQVG